MKFIVFIDNLLFLFFQLNIWNTKMKFVSQIMIFLKG